MSTLTAESADGLISPVRLPSPIGRKGSAEPVKYERKEWKKREQFHLGDYLNSVPDDRTYGPIAPERLDPFHDGLWMGGASAYWVSAKTLHARHSRWLTVDKKWTQFDHDEAVGIISSRRHLLTVIRMVAVLLAWRTCSAQQLSALVGDPRVLPLHPNYRRRSDDLLWAAFSAGLIDLGCFPSPAGEDTDLNGLVVRLNKTSATWKRVIEPLLTWPEWVAVTGGMEWDTSGQYDRHNLLTTELGLRVAEYLIDSEAKTPLANVLGERFSNHTLLTKGLPETGLHPADRRGDLMVLRRDGLRIVFETTATSKTAGHKARNWAELMRVAPLDVSGFVVVFVCAVDPENTSLSPQATVAETAAAIRSACLEIPGTVSNRTAERFGLIDWTEWFPERHAVSKWFETLNVARPTGPMDAPWERTDLTDPEQMRFAPAPHFDAKALVDNTSLLASVPWWHCYERKGLNLWRLLMTEDWDRYRATRETKPGAARWRPQAPARLRPANAVFTARETPRTSGRRR